MGFGNVAMLDESIETVRHVLPAVPVFFGNRRSSTATLTKHLEDGFIG